MTPSQFGWVDFSQRDRERMLDVIHMFQEHDTRDELGIGTIRDAFANHFFPGTSTIQTRARYMLFVPWVYLDLEARGVASSQIAQRARNHEIRLIYALLKSDDRNGLIGQDARERLQRLPSSIYWSGLGSWGIRWFPGSQDQYHRLADAFAASHRHVVYDDDKEPVDGPRPNWDPGLPDPPADLLQKTELALSQEDAKYLRDRVLMAHRHTLLALELLHGENTETQFPWEHPLVASLPSALRDELAHARNFSETMHGAPLLYNYMLARKSDSDELTEVYRQELQKWWSMLSRRQGHLREWHVSLYRFWSCAPLALGQTSSLTKRFVEDWLHLVFNIKHIDDLLESTAAQRLVHDREVRLKGSRSRLENTRQLELWTGAAGTSRLDYRWSTAQRLVRDISAGLQRDHG